MNAAYLLETDDQRELEYAERAVAFLLVQRKGLAAELAEERRIVNRLRRKMINLASELDKPELLQELAPKGGES